MDHGSPSEVQEPQGVWGFVFFVVVVKVMEITALEGLRFTLLYIR